MKSISLFKIILQQTVHICVALLLAYFFAATIFAQTSTTKDSSQDKCPTFTVSGPVIIMHGEPLIFLVKFEDEKLGQQFNFKWTVTGGNLIEGQGTQHIKVKVEDDTKSFTVTVTLEVEGLPENCPKAASATTDFITCGLPKARLIDKVQHTTKKELKERLGKFISLLEEEYMSFAYIFFHFGKRISARDRVKLVNIIKAEFTKRGIDLNRLTLVDDRREEKTAYEFWVVPAGTQNPQPMQNY